MLTSKFRDGLEMDHTGDKFILDRVVLYATTCDGASHLSSAVDIVLGCFSWIVNSCGHSTPDATQRRIFIKIANMMYGKRDGETVRMRDYGLILRPETIRVQAYQDEYDGLVECLTELAQE